MVASKHIPSWPLENSTSIINQETFTSTCSQCCKDTFESSPTHPAQSWHKVDTLGMFASYLRSPYHVSAGVTFPWCAAAAAKPVFSARLVLRTSPYQNLQSNRLVGRQHNTPHKHDNSCIFRQVTPCLLWWSPVNCLTVNLGYAGRHLECKT